MDYRQMWSSSDLYEFTMAAAYLNEGLEDEWGTFEYFVRDIVPREFLIVAGLEQFLDAVVNLDFSGIANFLESHPSFDGSSVDFPNYLRALKFTGDIYAMPEGTAVFANEPIIRVEAPIVEAQIIETVLLTIMNFQTMIASKAARIVEVAGDDCPVYEFGSRRAHGPHAAHWGARAAYIAGCAGTSNVFAGMEFGVPVVGTMAHSYIMLRGISRKDELDAFENYADSFPDGIVLLIDTYDTIKCIEFIIKRNPELLRQVSAVRIDSGDLPAMANAVRKKLDESGNKKVKIMLSGDLDEYCITSMLYDGVSVDSFGIGTKLVTSYDKPALGGVYKLVEYSRKHQILPAFKYSTGKETKPMAKRVVRQISGGIFQQDLLALESENVEGQPLLERVVKRGTLVRPHPHIIKIRDYCAEQRGLMRSASRKNKMIPVAVSSKLAKVTADTKHKFMKEFK